MTEKHISKSIKEVHQNNKDVGDTIVNFLNEKIEENLGKSIKASEVSGIARELVELQLTSHHE